MSHPVIYAVTGGTWTVLIPAFRRLLRSFKPIEADEVRQNRKDWYLQH